MIWLLRFLFRDFPRNEKPDLRPAVIRAQHDATLRYLVSVQTHAAWCPASAGVA